MTQLRYVVLRHERCDEPHFDVMFETARDSLLATWRAPRWPPSSGDHWTRIGDHRRIYLEYEGPLSDGGGEVRRVGAGRLTSYRELAAVVSATLDTGVRLALRKESGDQWRVAISA